MLIVALLVFLQAAFQGDVYCQGIELTCHCRNQEQCGIDGSCPSGCDNQTLPWAPWSGPGCQIGNVAYLKPASNSRQSAYQPQAVPSRGVDGGRNHLTSAQEFTWADGANGLPAYWMVDLGSLHVISDVTITRYYRSLAYNNRFTLFVSPDDVAFDESEKCALVEFDVRNVGYDCGNRVGRYVRVEQPNRGLVLSFTEADVRGYQFHQCSGPFGSDYHYGPGCLISCHCTQQCDVITGECLGSCVDGYTGTACQNETDVNLDLSLQPNCTACTYDDTGIRFFEDPLNCNRYFMCERLAGGEFRRHHMTCGVGTAWRQDLLTCDNDDDCWDGRTTVAPTTEDNSGNDNDCEFEPVPDDRTSYYQYVHSHRYTMPCPGGLQYSQAECGCVYPDESGTVAGSTVHTVRACEWHSMYLTCEVGTIHIQEAMYGRDDYSTCRHQYMRTDQCGISQEELQRATTTFRRLCEGRQSCSVSIRNSVFGEPCLHTYKYSRVNYTCGEQVGDESDECLIAKFPFDDGYTSVGAAGIVADPYGNARIRTDLYPNAALELDGSSYVKIEYFNNWFANSNIQEFSVSMWVYPHASFSIQGLVSNGDCSQTGSVQMYTRGNMLYGLINGRVTSFSGFRDRTWQHLSLVFSGAAPSLKLYYNGQLVYTNYMSGLSDVSIINRQCGISIGRMYTDEPVYFTGMIDDVAFFKCALSAEEVRQQYMSSARYTTTTTVGPDRTTTVVGRR